MKIHPVEAELLHANRRTDMTKPQVTTRLQTCLEITRGKGPSFSSSVMTRRAVWLVSAYVWTDSSAFIRSVKTSSILVLLDSEDEGTKIHLNLKTTNPTTRRHIPEDPNVQRQRCENINLASTCHSREYHIVKNLRTYRCFS
jgi:hypothetical protein